MNSMALVKLLGVTLLLAWSSATYAVAAKAKFYRYKDENGKTVVSSTLPPKYSQNGYEIVNELGMVLETIAPRKTPEQLAEEARQKRAQAEQARLLKEQQRLDQILIESYSDISDIERARDNELSSKQRDILLLKQNIRRVTRLLEDTQALAARDERMGQNVRPKTLREIRTYQERIAAEQQEILSIEEQMKEIEQRYNSSMVRFNELKAAEQLRRHAEGKFEDEGTRAIVHQCVSPASCDSAWQAALVYASENSTTDLAWANDTTIMMRKPKKDEDISLMISRVNFQDGRASIILEVRCNKTQDGEALCQSSLVNSIEEGFVPFLTGG